MLFIRVSFFAGMSGDGKVVVGLLYNRTVSVKTVAFA